MYKLYLLCLILLKVLLYFLCYISFRMFTLMFKVRLFGCYYCVYVCVSDKIWYTILRDS